jgi:hypothetical protein
MSKRGGVCTANRPHGRSPRDHNRYINAPQIARTRPNAEGRLTRRNSPAGAPRRQLESERPARVRGFKSLRFRQVGRMILIFARLDRRIDHNR